METDDITDVVTIDGPAGAGKSTVARRAAAVLGFAYLDTGAMYRAATWWAMRCGIDLNDSQAVAAAVQEMTLDMKEENGIPRVTVNGTDITEAIRLPEVTREVYRIDQNPAVRARLVALQRAFAGTRPTVAEGRDMSTVVFPKAKCKIYLDASLEERARRRALELAAKGFPVDRDKLQAELHDRDEKNRTRTVSPLRRSPDAVLLDTTHMTPDEVVDAIVRLARAAL